MFVRDTWFITNNITVHEHVGEMSIIYFEADDSSYT